jgi:hypothetical protein
MYCGKATRRVAPTKALAMDIRNQQGTVLAPDMYPVPIFYGSLSAAIRYRFY